MLLNDKDKHRISSFFSERLEHPVRLLVFSQDQSLPNDPLPCQYDLCNDALEIVEEVSELSDKIVVEVMHITQSDQAFEKYGVENVPCIAVMNGRDNGIRFYGIPSNYEFATFLEVIADVSSGAYELNAETIKRLTQIREPVHIQVFFTQTCALCPLMTHLVHQMALVNDYIHTDTIDAMEFPQLASSYAVRGVPHVVINENYSFMGLKTESELMDYIEEAVATPCPVQRYQTA